MSVEPAQSVEQTPTWGLRGTQGASIAGQLLFEQVSLDIQQRKILSDVSFSLQPGEIVSLLGPSGCGKTSLLRLASGGLWPTAGRILLDAQVIAGQGIQVPAEKRKIGLVFQDFVLFPHLSVAKNVAFGLKGWSKAETENAVHAALARVGMESRKEALPHHLSGGEQQRVALARAISPRPQVLLMDEPFSGLDQGLRRNVRDETLALLREIRASVILVTHDPAEALEVSDRIMLMNAGQIVQMGTPADIYNRPGTAWAAQFVGECNFFDCDVDAKNITTPFGRVKSKGNISGRAKVLIRPEHFTLQKNGIEGLVRENQFLGQSSRLKVAFAGLDKEVIMIMPATTAPLRGTLTEFGLVQPAQVFVFENAEAAPI